MVLVILANYSFTFSHFCSRAQSITLVLAEISQLPD